MTLISLADTINDLSKGSRGSDYAAERTVRDKSVQVLSKLCFQIMRPLCKRLCCLVWSGLADT